ncbi:hypothetical protein Cantr_01195 [Candida viswanathii]|uniref:Uncharacterized protein n=1 Tax=Candida viswanathii TaxID=5486 RepID=A0A367YKE2_9ASCO|nr:hypothetical protein Cantr_01195 [Candida viswanathii]
MQHLTHLNRCSAKSCKHQFYASLAPNSQQTEDERIPILGNPKAYAPKHPLVTSVSIYWPFAH